MEIEWRPKGWHMRVFMRMNTHMGPRGQKETAMELETCDNCGRTFRDHADGPDLDEVLCPRCREAQADHVGAALEDMPESEEEVEGWVAGAITEIEPEADVRTFAEAGVLTRNRGLVLRMPNGAEFQITIVRSR